MTAIDPSQYTARERAAYKAGVHDGTAWCECGLPVPVTNMLFEMGERTCWPLLQGNIEDSERKSLLAAYAHGFIGWLYQ